MFSFKDLFSPKEQVKTEEKQPIEKKMATIVDMEYVPDVFDEKLEELTEETE